MLGSQDMLLIGATSADGTPCLSAAEERTQMAIWSITASPLIMGNDVRNLSVASAAILLNKMVRGCLTAPTITAESCLPNRRFAGD